VTIPSLQDDAAGSSTEEDKICPRILRFNPNELLPAPEENRVFGLPQSRISPRITAVIRVTLLFCAC